MSKVTVGRRRFLKTVVGTSAMLAGLDLLPRIFATEGNSNAHSVVAVATNPKLCPAPRQMNQEVAQELLNKALEALTGKDSAAAAWKSLFRASDAVAIKVNCLGHHTHPTLAQAVVAGLLSAEVRPENILIWDRSSRELEKADFQVVKSGGPLCYGTDTLGGYAPRVTFSGSIGSCFSPILLSSRFTAFVNLPVLKDHDLAGVTLGLKNWFGGIHNPNKYHDNGCDPYIADLNLHPSIRKRLRLVICDASTPVYNGGPSFKPQWAWQFGGIMAATDPVALDRVGLKIIDEKRQAEGMRPVEKTRRPARHIFTAAEKGLGSCDLEKIRLMEL